MSDWVEIRPNGDSDELWRLSGMSDDGGTILSPTGSGKVYLSVDSGKTWSTVRSTADEWRRAIVSKGGAVLYLTKAGGRVVRSEDYGSNWTACGPSTGFWDIAASDDGSKCVFSNPETDSKMYVSSDKGATVAEVKPAGSTTKKWIAAISPDGSVILAAVKSSGRAYVSTNSGSSWTETYPTGVAENKNWELGNKSIGADNKTMIIGVSGGKLYRTQNGGASWSEIHPNYLAVGSVETANLEKIVLNKGTNSLDVSLDSGASWKSLGTPGANRAVACAITKDGSRMVVAAVAGFNSSGRLYIYTTDSIYGGAQIIWWAKVWDWLRGLLGWLLEVLKSRAMCEGKSWY